MISFWTNEPTILFNKDYITELWPTSSMCYEQKLNAISRLIILISLLGFTVEGDKVFNLYDKPNPNYNKSRIILNPATLETAVREEFKEGDKKNPFSNVLLTQIMDTPDRKAAPPSFNPEIEEDITKNIKKSVQFMNPGIKNTNKQLFGDLYERFELDNANRPFFSTANTRVTNDQGAFGKFLYGDMPSSKLSDAESGIQRIKDNYRYILY